MVSSVLANEIVDFRLEKSMSSEGGDSIPVFPVLRRL